MELLVSVLEAYHQSPMRLRDYGAEIKRQAPPPLCEEFEKEEKEVVLQNYRGRFQQMD